MPLEMNGALGRVVFEAAHRDPQTRVFWHVDQIAIAPPPGRHVLTLVDEAGETVRRTFSVLSRARDGAESDR